MDYSEYLGPNYKPPKKYATVISNHTSYFDPLVMFLFYKACMVSKAGVRNVPLVG